MSENGDSSEYGPQHGDAPGGLGDMLSSGSIERPPRRNLAAIVVSLVAVLAVIGGGVAYVGYHKLASSGAQPDEWAPASSVAYIKIDLDPAASEKIAALRFEQKFPDAPHVTSADQLKDALLSEAFDQPSSNIDYATDIKPWLGDRVALAAYPDASGKIQPVGILQVKDATQAQAGLTKLIHTGDGVMSTAGFAIEDDYAIVGPSQAAVDAAVAAARTSSITASNQYAADVATLGGDRIVTAWADLGAASKYIAKMQAADLSGALNSLSSASSSTGSGWVSSSGSGSSDTGGLASLAPGSVTSVIGHSDISGLAGLTGTQGLTNELKGRLVLGLSLQSGYAEISGRVIGGDTTGISSQNADAGALLGQLPAGSVAGVAVSGIGAAVSKELTTLESGPLASLGFKDELDAASAQLGISLPGDAVNLIGNGVAISLDSVPADGVKPLFTGIAEPTDVASGLKTAKALAGLLTTNGTPATATASGSHVIVTNDAAASGALGNDAGFKSAMSGMPDDVVAAAYVNLAGIWPAAGSKVPSDLQHLTGIGTYEALDGSDITFSVRVTVN
ncbi:MAG TPA: DUF3352 domain-containing protein [Acidothermaceae bacterium]|jgi:hypothetical protein